MNRGSESLVDFSGPSRPGFNEAPIHESGKRSVIWTSCWTRRRFNEAPIHESGKLGSA